MFAVIYSFKVRPGKEDDFVDGWKNLTRLIYQYGGSLGSRLHKESDYQYISYAQWPNKNTWEISRQDLPEEFQRLKKEVREACTSVETIHKLEIVEDLFR